MTTNDDRAQEQGSIADALDALNAIQAVGDEPERAHAAGPGAVRHAVMAWATRDLAAERALGAERAAAAALQAEVDAVRAEVGGVGLSLADAVRRHAGASRSARFVGAIARAAQVAGIAVAKAYATEEDALALLWQIAAAAGAGTAAAHEPRWARVELMGRTEAVGLLDEVEACGRRVLRLRELRPDGALEETYLMPGAVYRWRYVPEVDARQRAMPRWAMACGAYEDAGACPGRCRTCGRTREDHEAARVAREEKAAGAGSDGKGEGEGDDAPDSIPF